MSLPEPGAHVQSVFAVPEHINAVTLGGGCGETHFPQNGAVDCAPCAAVVTAYAFPVAPIEEAAPSPEQPLASPDASTAPVAEAAAPADPPTPKSKRSADTSA